MSDFSRQPLISVGMPVRNNAGTVELAVRSLLAQTYGEFELFLIDDGSTDETLDILYGIDDSRVRVFFDGGSLGLPTRLNQAIAASSGELFARMDGDDIAFPNRFARQVEMLQSDATIDLLGAWVVVFQDDFAAIGMRRPGAGHSAITARPASGFGMVHPTFMGRMTFFRRWHYRASAISMEDQDLLLRAHRESRFANVPEPLLGYREPRLRLGKILRARRHMAVGFSQEHLRQGKPALAARAAAAQVVRATWDTAAIGLRVNYGMLRHRAQPISDTERRRWDDVLAGLDITRP